VLVYAWVNVETTRRAYESSDDAYKVFRKMLAAEHPLNDWASLLDQAKLHSSSLGKFSEINERFRPGDNES
jgi:toxin YhaV